LADVATTVEVAIIGGGLSGLTLACSSPVGLDDRRHTEGDLARFMAQRLPASASR
jgi:hypothetical protein